MMDWKVILLILLVASYLIVIWFLTIKDMVKHFRYLQSQKKTNGTNNNDCNNKPEPECMRYIEGLNCQINCNNKPYNACYTKDNCERPNPPIIFAHTKHIISKVKRWNNQKQIKPLFTSLDLSLFLCQ